MLWHIATYPTTTPGETARPAAALAADEAPERELEKAA
jgi:hypothetical protein